MSKPLVPVPRRLVDVAWPPAVEGCPVPPAPGTWGWLGPVVDGGPIRLGGAEGKPRGAVYRQLGWYAADAEGEIVAEGNGRTLAGACAKVEEAAGAPVEVRRFPGWRLAGPGDPPPSALEPDPRPVEHDRSRSVEEGSRRYRGWWRTEEGGVRWFDHGPAAWVSHPEQLHSRLWMENREQGAQSRVFPVEELASPPADDTLVLLSEEYDEEFWLWRSGLGADALRRWWEALETSSVSVRDLPGTVESVAAIRFAGSGAHEVWSRRADADTATSPEYTILRAPPTAWTARLWQEDNSGLWTPARETLLHAGFTPYPGDSPEDFKCPWL